MKRHLQAAHTSDEDLKSSCYFFPTFLFYFFPTFLLAFGSVWNQLCMPVFTVEWFENLERLKQECPIFLYVGQFLKDKCFGGQFFLSKFNGGQNLRLKTLTQSTTLSVKFAFQWKLKSKSKKVSLGIWRNLDGQHNNAFCKRLSLLVYIDRSKCRCEIWWQ